LLHLVFYAYVVGSRLAPALPERLAYVVAEALGGLYARLSRGKRRMVARNLARVTGEPLGSARLEALVQEAYRSYARYWMETFRLARQSGDFFLERFECRHVERLDAVLSRGSGAVVVVGHLGNWDAAGAWAGASGRPMATVAEVVEPRRLFEFFREHRARLGITVYPAVPGIGGRLAAAAKGGKIVAILGDRDLAGHGVEVEFFGAKTTLPAGPASIATRARVPILVAGVYGVTLPGGKRGWEAEMGEPIEVPEGAGREAVPGLTREIARRLERYVARRPEEWHVFQPFWLEDRAR
jgi:lauroyl/myristoyl acyltransferase